jgi:hypothetical protein
MKSYWGKRIPVRRAATRDSRNANNARKKDSGTPPPTHKTFAGMPGSAKEERRPPKLCNPGTFAAWSASNHLHRSEDKSILRLPEKRLAAELTPMPLLEQFAFSPAPQLPL